MSERRFDIDDLPRFSPWPARLLGLELWQQRYKTAQEVTREYEGEKWGPLLKKVQEADNGVSVDEVDDWSFGESAPSLCSVDGDLKLMTAKETHRRHLNLVAEVLEQHLPASSLVELGCGYGTIILSLIKRDPFRKMRVIACEYTPSGVALVKQLAAAQGLEITTGHCDFTLPEITTLDIPEDSIIFTSFATPYIHLLSADFVAALSARGPKAVVHIEPCYEHCDEQTLIGLMRRRYIEVNGYNTNLMTVLRQAQKLGRIEIIEERPSVFGGNPLLAASIVVWRPRLEGFTSCD